MKSYTRIALVALACMFAMPLFAQTSTPRIDKREMRQQKRIHEGVKSGALTPREARHLERREARIRRTERRAKADGVVTPRERKKLNRELNRTSRDIKRKKHN